MHAGGIHPCVACQFKWSHNPPFRRTIRERERRRRRRSMERAFARCRLDKIDIPRLARGRQIRVPDASSLEFFPLVCLSVSQRKRQPPRPRQRIISELDGLRCRRWHSIFLDSASIWPEHTMRQAPIVEPSNLDAIVVIVVDYTHAVSGATFSSLSLAPLLSSRHTLAPILSERVCARSFVRSLSHDSIKHSDKLRQTN